MIFEIDSKLIDETFWFEEQVLAPNMTDFFNAKSVEYSKKGQCFDEDELF
jgi:ribonucleoside-diphosphate reductase beta chain